MTTYLLTHDVRASGQLLPLHKTVSADEIVHNDHFAIFRDDDGQPVYTVQRHLLLAIEVAEDQADDVEQDALPDGVLDARLKHGITTPNRYLLARQFGWSIEQVNEIPDWLAVWLHNAH